MHEDVTPRKKYRIFKRNGLNSTKIRNKIGYLHWRGVGREDDDGSTRRFPSAKTLSL